MVNGESNLNLNPKSSTSIQSKMQQSIFTFYIRFFCVVLLIKSFSVQFSMINTRIKTFSTLLCVYCIYGYGCLFVFHVGYTIFYLKFNFYSTDIRDSILWYKGSFNNNNNFIWLNEIWSFPIQIRYLCYFPTIISTTTKHTCIILIAVYSYS